VGAIIWTQSVIGLGIFLGDKISGSVDKYLLPIIGGIILISLIPVIIEVLKELNTRRNLS
ncbi:MAG: DedA family protein, partial [Candidatus Nanopelagicaceae bacterium]